MPRASVNKSVGAFFFFWGSGSNLFHTERIRCEHGTIGYVSNSPPLVSRAKEGGKAALKALKDETDFCQTRTDCD